MQWINNGISMIGNALGFSVMPKWRTHRLPLASRLRQIFADYQIDTVIDVGANEGQFGEFLRHEVDFAGRIESFEPVPSLKPLLDRKAAASPPWTIHTCALGAINAALPINVTASTDFSSFRNPIHFDGYDQDKNRIREKITVPVHILDDEFAGRDLHRTYLKLDTQGFDLEVLRGGRTSIAQIPALQMEVSFVPIYERMPAYQEAISTLEGYGFRIADFFLVSKDRNNRAIEFDCLMVRAS